jgi:hypothetical protein
MGSDREREPFLARFAVPADGDVQGRTLITEGRPETTDDEPGGGVRSPFQGRTIVTRVRQETTDD